MSASLGDLEVWSLENEGDGAHPFHMHGVFFQVLTRDGSLEPHLAWKDTVLIPAGATELAANPALPGRLRATAHAYFRGIGPRFTTLLLDPKSGELTLDRSDEILAATLVCIDGAPVRS